MKKFIQITKIVLAIELVLTFVSFCLKFWHVNSSISSIFFIIGGLGLIASISLIFIVLFLFFTKFSAK